MKMFTLIQFLILLASSPMEETSTSKLGVVGNLDILYFDHSRVDNIPGLSDGHLSQASSILKEVNAESDAVMLFLSNGDRPYVAMDKAAALEIIDIKIPEGTTSSPNQFSDKQQLINRLLEDQIIVTQNLRLHFFVTRNFIPFICEDIAWLTGILPIELRDLLGTSELNCEVYLYLERPIPQETIADLSSYNVNLDSDNSKPISFYLKEVR